MPMGQAKWDVYPYLILLFVYLELTSIYFCYSLPGLPVLSVPSWSWGLIKNGSRRSLYPTENLVWTRRVLFHHQQYLVHHSKHPSDHRISFFQLHHPDHHGYPALFDCILYSGQREGKRGMVEEPEEEERRAHFNTFICHTEPFHPSHHLFINPSHHPTIPPTIFSSIHLFLTPPPFIPLSISLTGCSILQGVGTEWPCSPSSFF